MNCEKLEDYLFNNFYIDISTYEIIENIINYLYNLMQNEYNKRVIIEEIYRAIFNGSRYDLTLDELLKLL